MTVGDSLFKLKGINTKFLLFVGYINSVVDVHNQLGTSSLHYPNTSFIAFETMELDGAS